MENQEVQNNSAHSIKWGVILGAVGIVLTLLLYIVDIKLLVSGWITGLSFLLSTVIVFYASFDYRKALGGYMTFGQAFLHAFVLLAISGLLQVIFSYLLFNVIDPQAAATLTEAQMEATMQMMESFGAGGNPEAMDKMAEGFESQYSLGTMALGYVYMLVVYSIGAVIVALISKKKNKELDF